MADGKVVIDTEINSKPTEQGLKSMAASLVKFAAKITAVAGSVKLLTKAVTGMVSAARQMEDITAEFTPLTGGAEKATKMIDALNKQASSTPYELTQIADVAKQLLPAVGNNISEITKQFRMLGDTAGGNIQRLQSITKGYTKVLLKGKVDMESLNMIADAGVPIYQKLADSLGVSVSQMYSMSSAGKITAKDLRKAFKKMTSAGGIYYNGMSIASKTLSGLLSTMRDNVKQTGAEMGTAFLPVLKVAARDISNAAIKIKTFIKQTGVAKTTAESLTKAYSKLKNGVKTLVQQIKSFAKQTQIISRLMTGLQKYISNIKTTIDAFRSALSAVISTPGVQAFIKSLRELGTALLTAFSDTGFLSDFGTNIAESINAVFGNEQVQKVVSFAAEIASRMISLVTTVITQWDNLGYTIALGIVQIEYAFKRLGTIISTSMATAFNSVKIGAVSLGQTIVNKVINKISAIFKVLSMLPGDFGVFDSAKKSLDSFRSSFDNAADKIKDQSAQTIADSKKAQQQQQSQYDRELDNIKRNYDARIAANNAAREDAKNRITTITTDTGDLGDSGKVSTPAIPDIDTDNFADTVRTALQELQSVRNEISARLADGVINQDDATIRRIDAIRDAMDALYKQGISTKTAGAGGDALKALRVQLENLQAQIDPTVAGKKLGLSLWAGIASAFTAIKDGGDIKKSMVDSLKSTGKAIKTYLPVITKALSKGWTKKLATFASTAMHTVGAAVRGVANTVVSGIKTLSTLAALDPSDLLDSLDDFLDNIETFFTSTLPALPIYAQTAITMIASLVSSLLANWDTISDSIVNAILSTIDIIVAQLPTILTSIITMITTLATKLIKALPDILSKIIAFLTGSGLKSILSALVSGVREIAAALLEALPDVLDSILSFIDNGLPDILDALVSAAETIVKTAVKMIPTIITFVLKAIGSIGKTLAKLLPQIVEIISDVLPDAMVALLSQLPLIIKTTLQLITAATEAILESIPDIIDAVSEIIPAVVVQLAVDSPEIVQSIIEMAGQIVAAIVANIPAIVAAVLMIIPKVLYGLAVALPDFAQAGVDLVYSIGTGITSAASSIWSAIDNIVSGALSGFSGIYSGVVSIFSGIGSAISSAIKSPINAIIRMINYVISGLNKLSFKLPSWIPGIGGKKFGVNISKIDYLAKGTKSARGGLTMINEKGPELVNMPHGAQVYTADETKNILSGSDFTGVAKNLQSVQVPSTINGMSASKTIVVNSTITGNVDIDGMAVAQATWQNIDKIAAGE